MKKYKLPIVLALVIIMALSIMLVACNPDGDSVYTVTFEGEGVQTFTQTVLSGGTLTKPENPTRDGYLFLGWRKKNADGSTEDVNYDFSTVVNASFTLVAAWESTTTTEATQFTVTLNPGLGTVGNTTVTVKKGESFDLGVATRDKYVFTGWKYNNAFITDSTGKSLDVYGYDYDITVVAEFGSDQEDLERLAAAIAATGDNFTAQYFTLGSNKLAFTYSCTPDKFLKDYNSTSQLPEGFMIQVDDFAYKIIYSQNDDGSVSGRVDDNIYQQNGRNWGLEDVQNAYYVTHILKTEYFVNISTDSSYQYKLKPEYIKTISATLYPDGAADTMSLITDVIVDVSGGRLSKIQMLAANQAKIVIINITSIGNTSVDLSGMYIPFISQLPNTSDPQMPTAPETFGYKNGNGVKSVDSYTDSEFVNGAQDSNLKDLDDAIKKARGGVSYTLSDSLSYLSTSVSDSGSTSNERSTSERIYKLQFGQDKRAYIARTSGTAVEQYVVQSANKTYLIDYYPNGTYKYREVNSWEKYTIGGNIFNKINASMFEASGSDGSTYKLKKEYTETFFRLMFYTCTDKELGDSHLQSVYSTQIANAAPTMEPTSATITMNSLTGQIMTIQASGVYHWSDGKSNDTHTITITVNNGDNSVLKMPYEWGNSRYDSDQLKLRYALDRINYYTLEFNELNTVVYKEYWGKDVVYKEIWTRNDIGGWVPKEYGSNGWIFINDYAYVFELSNGKVDYDLGLGSSVVPTEPYYKLDKSEKYYRAYMYTVLSPLAQIDPLDFAWDNNVKAYKCKSNLYTYAKSEVLGWFDNADEATDMYIFMDGNGDLSQIFFGTIKNSSGELEKQEQYVINVLNINEETQYKL